MAVVQVKTPGEELPDESRYSALHVLEDGKWHTASVREWAVDPATDVSLKALEWLVGEWTAKGEAGELRITYAWDENKTFLNARYTITDKDGKAVTSGLQVLGRNPDGGLKSWLFDSSGATGHAVWVRDGTRWLSEVAAVLPDGTEITSLSIAVRVSPDSFTWQTTDRAVNGEPLPALPPVKVAQRIVQLAVNKDGVVRGNYFDAVADSTLPVYGSVDRKTQRIAWSVGEKRDIVFETGLANLTKDESTVLIHYGKERTDQMMLARLEEPRDK